MHRIGTCVDSEMGLHTLIFLSLPVTHTFTLQISVCLKFSTRAAETAN